MCQFDSRKIDSSLVPFWKPQPDNYAVRRAGRHLALVGDRLLHHYKERKPEKKRAKKSSLEKKAVQICVFVACHLISSFVL